MAIPHSPPVNRPSDPTPARAGDDCGVFAIRIAADGTWHHRGSPITRPALVRLFARALKRDAAGDYWLQTPVERGRIEVEDAPFVAVEVINEGHGETQRLRFRTNIDEWVTADADHPLRMRAAPGKTRSAGGPRPYLSLDGGLEALVARPVYYRLVELAVEREVNGAPAVGVWSDCAFFPLAVGDDAVADADAP